MSIALIENIDLTKISTLEQSRELNVVLMNTVEILVQQNEQHTKQIQDLKDEINRLKGEKGKPTFKPNKESTRKGEKTDKKPRNKNNKRGSKKGKVKIDKEVICEVDKAKLPTDAKFKGYVEHIQQELEIKRVNTLYKMEVYYSARTHKTYQAELPEHGKGMYGSGVKTWLNLLNRCCDTTQGRLKVLFSSLGISISAGTINNYLLEPEKWVLKEQKEILKAGISSGSYCQIDGTKSVERGVSKVTQIICGAFFTTFHTKPNKKRLSVIEALLGIVEGQDKLQFGYNEYTKEMLITSKVSRKDRNKLESIFGTKTKTALFEWQGDHAAFEKQIKEYAPAIMSKTNMYQRVMESFALGYYYCQDNFPTVEYLLSDDAPEYNKLSRVMQALCWIHDARYYKKLIPKLQRHRDILSKLMDEYWSFYNSLLAYKKATKKEQEASKKIIEQKFDELFNQETQYYQLNDCLKRTLNNKEKLLTVLENPALPLHNNAAELGARRIVRKRDISLHTWSLKGTQVRDAFMSIIQTCLKVDISPFEYISDRVSGKFNMPLLSNVVDQQTC